MKLFLSILVPVILLLSGCTKSTDRVVHINCDGLITDTLNTGDTARIYMQNAFSPNGDGLNDMIRPIPINISALRFTIFDENNSVVYTTDSLYRGWNTTVSSNSVEKYYYKIQATTNSGNHIGLCGELYKLSCFPSNISRNTLFFEDQLMRNGAYAATSLEILPNCP